MITYISRSNRMEDGVASKSFLSSFRLNVVARSPEHRHPNGTGYFAFLDQNDF